MAEECPVIIGMACRVPGANNPTKLWENIVKKTDLQRPMPKERFNIDAFYHPNEINKGTINTKYGYFLDQPLGLFDAEFFSVSGKEAEAMDPQQRMLLETVYEALENAGITLDEIRGTRTSVFCGAFTTSNDYHALQGKDLEYYPKYAITGSGNAILSNRISYFYNLSGPSMTVDTGCSSSLVCFHLGSQSLLNGEADMSIIIGSALHFVPNTYQTMSDMGFISSDGRCHSFDASGSGYVRGDGICAVVLKRHVDALQSKDRIRAVVRATAVNHDGKTDGITLPSPEAQEALIRATYLKAGLDPDGTQYFEAHGTGTKAGDPREAKAIGSVFGTPTRHQPLYVGSIKSNIGHLEGAAGLAGVIKTTLAIENGKIPPNMLFEIPNPDIRFKEWKITVPTTEINWNTPGNVPRRASINSFGYGGANAHVILESCPAQGTQVNGFHVSQDRIESRPYLLPITSHSQEAGKLAMSSLRNYVRAREDLIVEDLAYSLSYRRSKHNFRSFAIGNTQGAVLGELETPRPTAAWTSASDTPLRIGFVFTGQGAQSYDMGRQLIHHSPTFKAALERCDAVLQSLPDGPSWSIIGELLRSEGDSQLSQSKLSQPICTALQLAIVSLLKEWGVSPTAVCGHSSGEIAAAYAAGILSLEAAIVAGYYRGLHMSQGVGNSTPGSMMAVGLTESEARVELEGYRGRLTIAAVNSLSSVTVSGDKDAILELKGVLLSRKVFARQLQVEQAFHSHHMLPLAPGYERALLNCPHFDTQEATCRMFSSVTARAVEPSTMNASYWAQNMVKPVRFSDALTGVLLDEDENQNVDVLVEIGPHPALKGPSREVASSLKMTVPYVASLNRGQPAFDSLLETAGQLFAVGYPINLEIINQNHILANGKVVHSSHGKILEDLPSYSWNHKNYWSVTRLVKEHLHRPWKHTILGAPVPGSIDNMPRWRNYIRLTELPWLRDHMVDGKVVFPAAGYICMAIESAVRLRVERPSISVIRLKEVFIKAPLSLREDTEQGYETLIELRPVTASARTVSDDWYEFSVSSYDEAGQYTEHARGSISIEYGIPQGLRPLKKYPSIKDLIKKSDRYLSASALYARLESIGLHYGERFALLKEDISSGPGFSVTSLTYNPNVFSAHELAERTVLHPTLLDASFHMIFSAIETLLGRDITDAFVSTFMGSLDISGLLAEPTSNYSEKKYTVQTHTQLPSQRTAINEILLQQQDGGQVILEAQGVEVTALGTDSAKSKGRALFFRQRWQPCFELLTPESSVPLQLHDLEALVDLYTFQRPSSKILHVSSQPEDTYKILRHLIPAGTERPLFRTMHVLTSASQNALEFQGLEKDSGGLVKVCSPEGTYDLIIFDRQASGALLFDPTKFMNQSSVLVSNAAPSADKASFETIIPLAHWGAFRQKQPEPGRIDLTVVLPSSKVSKSTEGILHRIRTSEKTGQVQILDFETLSQRQTLTRAIVVLTSLDEGIETPETWAGVRHLLTLENKAIIWVLEGAVMECSNPDHAKVIGLLKTARNENQQSRFISLDVGKSGPAELTSNRILQALDERLGEEELAVRNGCVYIPRIEEDVSLNRKLPNGVGSDPQLQRFGNSPALSLRIGKAGLLETLHFVEDEVVTNEPLGEDELEIKVKASALNFHDIAVAMGIIQDYKLGNECAGVVVRAGSGVDSAAFKPGDRVIAWRPGKGAHATLVRQPAMMSVKIPDSMSFSLAASLSVVLTTAHYALVDLGRLQPGETILIHSAAGGVGQIAIQIAQKIGARVLATCSGPKRELLRRRYGLDDSQIFSSRDDSFVRGVYEATGGKGVDVALNSLAGKLLQATWNCMNNLGRFVEIGKRDIHQNSNLAMDPFRKNVIFASVDLITVYDTDKAFSKKLLDASFELYFSGDVAAPEGLFEFPYSQAEKAFRMLQLGKHTGKVVLVPEEDNVVLVAPPEYGEAPLFSPKKSYLFVGGLGGLGTAVAEWMYRRGARIFAFLSRSGDQKPYARKTVDWLRSKNAKVTVYQGDVSILSEVKKVVADIGPSLGGVFHAAVVLQDAMIRSMTLKQLQICLLTKCGGAQNLHKATVTLDLDFFVCFSSVSAMCGNKGQAAYVAANAYLDAMMRWRRENGLVGTAMTVGAVPSRGLVAENLHIRQSLERNKLDILTEQELMYLVEEAVTLGNPKSDPKGVDWHQLIVGVNVKQPDVWWAERSLFRNLYANREYGHSSSAGKVAKKLAVLLATAPDAEGRTAILLEAFIEKVAAVLGTPIESIASSNPLSFYGLDSIVAVEFRKWFKETADVDLSLFDVLSAKSIHSLVAKVVTLMPVASLSDDGQQDSTQPKGSQGLRELGPDTETTVSHIPKANVSGPIPMSTFQLGMFFLHSFSEEKWRLNLSGIFHLKGKPSVEALRQSHREVVLRHPVLNTAFFNEGDILEQKVLPEVNFNLTFHDFSKASSPRNELEDFISRHKHRELNIEQGEVGITALVKMSDEEYTLIVVLHHICFDRGSLFIFMDTWVDLYNAISTGRDIETIPAPRVTYADFVLWHNERLKSDKMLPHLTFWKENLNGVPEASKLLPFAKMERPSVPMPSRSIHQLQLNGNLFKRMKRICSQINATPFHFLLAAFRAFLFRYTEDRDVVLLMVDGNRPHVDVEDLVGCFVNMIPVRFRENCAEMGFEDLVRTATATTLQALSHSELPFDEIVNALKLPRKLGQMPIGQISVNYQMHGAVPTYRTQDFEVTTETLGNIPIPYEIGLEAVEAGDGGLDLSLEYSTALYGADDMGRFLENFLVFLTSSIQDHRQPIAEINMCGPKELKRLQESYWNTELIGDAWADSTVVQKIQQVAESTPHAEAIRTSSGNAISYSELLRKASALAFAIKQAGGGPSGAVGVLAQPGIECIIGMLATLIASSCYVPLDPSSASDRLSFVIRDAGINVLLTTEEMEVKARGIVSKSQTEAQIISIKEASRQKKNLPIPATFKHEQPFYMIYTSGSTGYPKGVTLTHGSTRQMLSCLHRDYKFSPKDRFLLATSISFDLSVVQIFSPLTCGATMCIAEQDTRKDPTALADFMLKEAVTFTYFTSTQLSLLLGFAGDTLRKCHSYRLAFMCGERLPARLVRAFYDLGLPARMYNLYGLSETIVQNTSQEVAYPTADESVPIGFGLDNNRLYIVDSALHPLPVGLPGELCIGGAMVGTGYRNLLSKTRDAFVPNPFCSEGDRSRGWTKMFRTGDEARFRPDGALDFIGRKSGDKQVKLRGHRIDLEEVENQLRSAPNFSQGFVDVVVLLRLLDDEKGELAADDMKLIAFLVPKKPITEPAKHGVILQLHESARKNLNAYMLPTGYQLLGSFPFLPSTKLDRDTLSTQTLNDLTYPLSTPKQNGITTTTTTTITSLHHHSPSTEDQIIQIFQQVLKTDITMDPNTNFVDVGGNSVLIVQVQSQIRKAFGLTPSLAQMFNLPTPKALADVVRQIADERAAGKNGGGVLN